MCSSTPLIFPLLPASSPVDPGADVLLTDVAEVMPLLKRNYENNVSPAALRGEKTIRNVFVCGGGGGTGRCQPWECERGCFLGDRVCGMLAHVRFVHAHMLPCQCMAGMSPTLDCIEPAHVITACSHCCYCCFCFCCWCCCCNNNCCCCCCCPQLWVMRATFAVWARSRWQNSTGRCHNTTRWGVREGGGSPPVVQCHMLCLLWL